MFCDSHARSPKQSIPCGAKNAAGHCPAAFWMRLRRQLFGLVGLFPAEPWVAVFSGLFQKPQPFYVNCPSGFRQQRGKPFRFGKICVRNIRTALRQSCDVGVINTVRAGLDNIQFWRSGPDGADWQNGNQMTFRPVCQCLLFCALFAEIDGKPLRVTLFSGLRVRLAPKKCAPEYLPRYFIHRRGIRADSENFRVFCQRRSNRGQVKKPLRPALPASAAAG